MFTLAQYFQFPVLELKQPSLSKHGLLLDCHDGMCSLTAPKATLLEPERSSVFVHRRSLVYRFHLARVYFEVHFINEEQDREIIDFYFINSKHKLTVQRWSKVSNTSNYTKSNDASEAACKEKNLDF